MRASAAGLLVAVATRGAYAQQPSLALMTAGQGSAFLPYGQGLAKVLAAAGLPIEVKESKGSNENLGAVDGAPGVLGTAFLGSAFDAVSGTGFANGRRHTNIRALFPMYETAFMVAALRTRGLTSLKSLQGTKVGCGPAGGPAEGYFRAAADVAGITATIVSGTPADQGRQLLAGEIDAFWQGAVVPIPSLVAVTSQADCVVFGLDAAELAALLQRFPFMADVTVPTSTYRGQTDALRSIAAWNVVIAHQDLPADAAYAITKAVLTATDLAATIGPAAKSTTAANAGVNKVVPYHPGAVRALAELGVKVP